LSGKKKEEREGEKNRLLRGKQQLPRGCKKKGERKERGGKRAFSFLSLPYHGPQRRRKKEDMHGKNSKPLALLGKRRISIAKGGGKKEKKKVNRRYFFTDSCLSRFPTLEKKKKKEKRRSFHHPPLHPFFQQKKKKKRKKKKKKGGKERVGVALRGRVFKIKSPSENSQIDQKEKGGKGKKTGEWRVTVDQCIR